MMNPPHIVAVAARTPLGLCAESTAAAARAGVVRLREHPFMVDAAGDRLVCGLDALLPTKLFGADRMALLAASAIRELMEKLPPGAGECPLILCLPEERPGFGSAEANRVLRAAREAAPAARVERGPEGHAGCLAALERAVASLAAGAGRVLVLGVDSYLQADTLDWLEADRRVMRAEIRSGFPPGEGAAGLALMGDETRRELGLSSLGRLRGIGQALERRSRKSAEGLLGEALADALRAASQGLNLPEEAVDDLYSDINGERHRSEDWCFALMRHFQLTEDGTYYQTSADLCGDVGAATGALGCVLATRAWTRSYAKGPRSLVWAGSDSGLRAAAVVEQGGW